MHVNGHAVRHDRYSRTIRICRHAALLPKLDAMPMQTSAICVADTN